MRRAEERRGEANVRKTSKKCPGKNCPFHVTRNDGCKICTVSLPFISLALCDCRRADVDLRHSLPSILVLELRTVAGPTWYLQVLILAW